MRAAARWCDDAANLLLGVKFWQYASVALRWASAAILKAAKGFSGWRNSQAGTGVTSGLEGSSGQATANAALDDHAFATYLHIRERLLRQVQHSLGHSCGCLTNGEDGDG